MKFENTELETTFEVSEPLTLRERLRYDSAVEWSAGNQTYERLWQGVISVAKNWESPIILSDGILDEAEEDRTTRIVKWAGTALFGYMYKIRQVEKN